MRPSGLAFDLSAPAADALRLAADAAIVAIVAIAWNLTRGRGVRPSLGNFAFRVVLAVGVAQAYLLAALSFGRAAMRLPPLARRGAVRFSALAAAAIVALAAILPNLFSSGGSFEPDFSPLNIAGIGPVLESKSAADPMVRPGPHLRYHLRCAAGLLAVALLLHARPFVRSLRVYLTAPPPANQPPNQLATCKLANLQTCKLENLKT